MNELKRVNAPKNGVEFGWGAPPMKEQHPVIPADDAAQFDKDNEAIIRLSVRGIITPSQRDYAIKRVTKRIGETIRRALAEGRTE